MKYLILGANGQVGRALQAVFSGLGRGSALGRDGCDLKDPKSILHALETHQPQVILNAAAYTAVDAAEDDQASADAINATAVGVLANWAKQNGALLVHYSTDYVFDGTKDGVYYETDAPSPLSVYGRTKLAGEEAIQATGCKHLIFRTSWVYDLEGKNFPNTILRLAKERAELSVIDDQHGAPTHAALIADVTLECVTDYLNKDDATQAALSGIYNLVPNGETTWYGFAKHLVEAASHSLSLQCNVSAIKPIPSSAYPTKAKRPQNSRLSVEKIEKTFAITLPDWTDHANLFIKAYLSKS